MDNARNAPAAGPVRPYESDVELPSQGKIDDLVFGRLAKAGITPARTCSDEVFLRRVYVDVIGTLPTAEEARQFLADKTPGKRRALIERLLKRDEFVDCWTTKWCDILRVKAEFPINLWPNAVQAYHHWIREAVRQNMPYDQFARTLLTSSGSNFRMPPVNFYRAVQAKDPATIAQAVALTFLGTRADRWPKARLAGMAAFFSRIEYKHTDEWKEEIVLFNPAKALTPLNAVFPDGKRAVVPAGQDPRAVFANWLVSANNAWFAQNVVNRVWSWLMGRGIVQEPDDIRPDNPPSNPELLAYLERDFVAAHYDLRHLYRLILNSKTYQLSSIPRSNSPKAEALFARYPVRRLDAEVLIDALNALTGTTESYSSATPEPFTFVPEDQRSLALSDGSITSSFLEMFGRPARDTGLESERTTKPTADQRLHMLNSSHVERKIERAAKLVANIRADRRPGAVIEQIYLSILSRYPTPAELRAVVDYAGKGAATGRAAAVDVAWALVNSDEFLYRH